MSLYLKNFCSNIVDICIICFSNKKYKKYDKEMEVFYFCKPRKIPIVSYSTKHAFENINTINLRTRSLSEHHVKNYTYNDFNNSTMDNNVTDEKNENKVYSPIIDNIIDNSEYTYEIIVSNLQVISQLLKGQKLWLDKCSLTLDNSWFPRYSRWSYSQSREQIIPCVKETIHIAIYKYKHDDVIKQLLNDCINGLNNMIFTYENKNNEINELIQYITNGYVI